MMGSAGIAVDADGFAYLTGSTISRDFPTVKPFQGTHGGGIRDVFITKVTPTGSALVYSTFLGGTGDDNGRGIAVDMAGSIYVTGRTGGGGFPTVKPLQSEYGGWFNDAFIAKINHTPEPEILVNPIKVEFGGVKVGKSDTKRFAISNNGDAGLAVSEIVGFEAPFALVGPFPPFIVTPGERVKVRIRFTPTEEGKVLQTIVIKSNDNDDLNVKVTLKGKGK